MALGDGSSWDETTPTDATIAIQIDDYNRDLRKGTSARMRFEHEWPDSQSATSEGGKHKFMTLQDQGAKPTLAGTQVGAIYQKTSNLWFENSAGTEIQIVAGTSVGDGKVLVTATDTAGSYLVDAVDGTSLGIVNTTAGSEVVGIVGMPSSLVYDSGWFEATSGGSYAKTHGLGTDVIVVKIYFSTASDGSTSIYDVNIWGRETGFVWGALAQDITANTLTIQAGNNGVIRRMDSNGGGVIHTTGYYKAVAFAVA